MGSTEKYWYKLIRYITYIHTSPASQRLHRRDEISNGDNLVALLLQFRQHHLEHGHGPASPVVADDDGAGVDHAEYVASIHRRVGYLRVVRVDAAQDDAEPPVAEHVAHAKVEEAGAGPEVVVGQDLALGLVGVDELGFHGADLGLEVVAGQVARGLVTHGVVAELVAGVDEAAEGLGPPRGVGLGAYDEEGGVGVVLAENLHDVGGVRGRGVVDGQGDNLLGGVDLEEDVWVLGAQVGDDIARRAVDAVYGVEGEDEEESEQSEQGEGRHSIAADAAPDLGGEAEEVESGHGRVLGFL